MNLNDPGVDTVIAQLAVNDKAADESEGLITDIVAFFEPEPVWPLEVRVALSLSTLLAHPSSRVFGSSATWEELLSAALDAAAAELELL